MKHKTQLETIALKVVAKFTRHVKAAMIAGEAGFIPCPRAAKFTHKGETNEYGEYQIKLDIHSKRFIVIAAGVEFSDGSVRISIHWQTANRKLDKPIFVASRTCIDDLGADADNLAGILTECFVAKYPSTARDSGGAP